MSACPQGGEHDWELGTDRKFHCTKCGAQSARRL
ncbi:putative membrane protein YvbJ [Nocardiopsis mwathae]|uniref:Putative membrane protein YvbJ n=1 Tax=Nocardiopsis mwathae TaxID=1472723 RepID=A0A7X0D624_9ACTN|nr:putative membrane protein YvbJ [Nocardiopsis mwathae]